jgi:hypothetical protein
MWWGYLTTGAVVKFPRVAEPGERWAERSWVAVPWISNPGRGLYL